MFSDFKLVNSLGTIAKITERSTSEKYILALEFQDRIHVSKMKKLRISLVY